MKALKLTSRRARISRRARPVVGLREGHKAAFSEMFYKRVFRWTSGSCPRVSGPGSQNLTRKGRRGREACSFTFT